MEPGQPPSVQSLLLRSAKLSSSFADATSRRNFDKLREVCKALLDHQRDDSFLRDANNDVLVKLYASDGTSLLLNKAWTKALGCLVIRRHGKKCSEYLVDRTYYKGKDVEVRMLLSVNFRDLVPLRSKVGWALFSILAKASPSLRSHGFRGPAVSHYVRDRGCFTILDRLVRQFH